MWSIVTRLIRWFANMRRRPYYGRFGSGVVVVPPPAPPPSPPPPPPPPPSVTYSTLMGTGVDSIGYALLPLRASAVAFYVNPGAGNDANDGLTHATALNTMAAAKAKVVNNRGDHILVREGSTTSETPPQLVGLNGFSPQYPLTIESYNPAAPTDQTYWGRGYQRGARPKLTGTAGWAITPQSGVVNPPNFLAIRGFDFDAAALTDLQLSGYSTNNTPASYWLIEGNLFKYHSINFAMILGSGLAPRDQALMSDTIIIRNNSGRGNFSSTQSEGGSGLYLDGWKGAIVTEDNVWYHRGWKETAVRGDDYTIGGPNKFKHTAYIQTTNDGTPIWRRNLSSDGAADGGQFRRGGFIIENLFLDNPISITAGGGTQYNVYQPDGVYSEPAYNVTFGSADFAPGDPAGTALAVKNTTSLSVGHHNLFARSFNPATTIAAFDVGSDFSGSTTTFDAHNNIAYLWATNATTFAGVTVAGATTTRSYEDNYTDANASGSNLNISSLTAPNPYTPAQFYTAMFAAVPAIGAATKSAFIEYAVAYPEAHIQRTGRQVLMDGYGMTDALGDLAMRSNFIVGVASTIEFIGGTPGSTFTGTMPSGLTLNSSLRSITYDGSGGTTSGNLTITETPLLGSPKVNTVAYAVQVAPTTLNPADKSANITLSGGSLTALAPGALAAVRAVRALGAGKYYWEFNRVAYADICSPGVFDSVANLDSASYFALTANAHAAAYFDGALRYNTTTQSYTLAAGTWGFAYDGATETMWARDSAGWHGDPVAGTGGLSLSGMGASRFVGFQGDGGDKGTFNFGGSALAYAQPTGFGNV